MRAGGGCCRRPQLSAAVGHNKGPRRPARAARPARRGSPAVRVPAARAAPRRDVPVGRLRRERRDKAGGSPRAGSERPAQIEGFPAGFAFFPEGGPPPPPKPNKQTQAPRIRRIVCLFVFHLHPPCRGSRAGRAALAAPRGRSPRRFAPRRCRRGGFAPGSRCPRRRSAVCCGLPPADTWVPVPGTGTDLVPATRWG